MSARQSSASADSPTRRRIPLVARVVFVVALLFTTIGTIETLFIVYDRMTGGSLSAERAPDLGLGIRSWTEHHAMRPGYDIPPTHTNSFGLRSPEIAIPKPPGIFRILLLGDSFTLGFRAGDDEVFARKLERRLRETYHTSSIEVINAGVLSYCPLLEDLQYRHHLHILEPDLVMLNFDMSDVQDHMDYARNAVFSSDGTPLFVTEPSLRGSATWVPALLSFEWVARHANAAKRRFDAGVEGSAFARDLDRYAWAVDGGPDLDREVTATLSPIADLQRLLEHYNVPFVLSTYPQPWQVSAEATPLPPIRTQYGIGQNTVHLNDRPFRKLDAFAKEHNLPFINATSAFRNAPQPAALFLANDFHFSPLGHDLYADVLATYIIQHSLVSSHLPTSTSVRRR